MQFCKWFAALPILSHSRRGEVNPVSDMEVIELELMLADIQSLDTALPKAERSAKSGDKEAKLRVAAITACLAHLKQEKPLRSLQLPEPEAKSIASFGLMTAKPILYIANVDETDILGKSPLVMQVREFVISREQRGASVCQAGGRDRRTGRARSNRDVTERGTNRTGAGHGGSRNIQDPGLAKFTSLQVKRKFEPGRFPLVPPPHKLQA